MAKQLREYTRQSTQRRSAEQPQLEFEDDVEDDFREILSNIINEDYIIAATGIKDLSKVEYVSLQIDTKEQALYDLSEILPNLKHLVLDSSHIGSIRDLGTGLRHITSLSMTGCNLRDLDGIGVLAGLQELCVSDNLLSDIAPLTMHENLQNLNLSNNKICDLTFGVVLSSCPKLRSIFLARNPLDRISSYRQVVSYLIANLEMLDGLPIDPTAVAASTTLMDEAQEELDTIREELEEELRVDVDIYEDAMGRPKHSSQSSSDKTSYLMPIHADTSDNRDAVAASGSSSELTHGSSSVVLAGGMAAAMRRRRVEPSLSTAPGHLDNNGESTLDILDSALLRVKTPTTRSASEKMSLVIEGDITEMVLGSPARVLNKPGFSSSPTKKSLTSVTKQQQQQATTMSSSFDVSESRNGSRPKSAFSGSALRSSDKGYVNPSGGSSKSTTPEKKASFKVRHDVDDRSLPPRSPRQRNSSRPQSAVSPSELNTLLHHRSLPFVVARATAAEDEDGSEDDEDGGEIDHAGRVIASSSGASTARPRIASSVVDKVKTSSTSTSIVHQNLVRRFKASSQQEESSLQSPPLSSRGGASMPMPMVLPSMGIAALRADGASSDEEDDDEDIAVTHSERLRMTIKQESLGNNNTMRMHQQQKALVLQRLKMSSSSLQQQQHLQQQQQRHTSMRDGGAEVLEEIEDDHHPVSSQQSTPRRSSRPSSASQPSQANHTSASKGASQQKVEQKLGFHLAGSLAAIDRWVQEDEEEDDDLDHGNSVRDDQHLNRVGTSTAAAVEDTARSRPPLASTTKDTTNSSSSKILSRDAIFHLCWNAASERPRSAGGSRPMSSTSTRKSSMSSAEGDEDEHMILASSSEHARRKTPVVTADYEEYVKPSRSSSWSQEKQKKISSSSSSSAVKQSNHKVPALVSASASSSTATATNNTQRASAVHMQDDELVALLRKPPKTVVALRTKASFQEFFQGIDSVRFSKLLHLAYADITDPSDRAAKIRRRMKLMEAGGSEDAA